MGAVRGNDGQGHARRRGAGFGHEPAYKGEVGNGASRPGHRRGLSGLRHQRPSPRDGMTEFAGKPLRALLVSRAHRSLFA